MQNPVHDDQPHEKKINPWTMLKEFKDEKTRITIKVVNNTGTRGRPMIGLELGQEVKLRDSGTTLQSRRAVTNYGVDQDSKVVLSHEYSRVIIHLIMEAERWIEDYLNEDARKKDIVDHARARDAERANDRRAGRGTRGGARR